MPLEICHTIRVWQSEATKWIFSLVVCDASMHRLWFHSHRTEIRVEPGERCKFDGWKKRVYTHLVPDDSDGAHLTERINCCSFQQISCDLGRAEHNSDLMVICSVLGFTCFRGVSLEFWFRKGLRDYLLWSLMPWQNRKALPPNRPDKIVKHYHFSISPNLIKMNFIAY